MSELKPSTMTDDERLKLITWLESRAQGSTMPGASRMYKLALDAIRAQPTNEPLTLEQLRQMDGEPVWIPETEAYFSGYGIVNVKEEKVYQSNEDGDYYPFDEYGSWLAYARKPEGSAAR